MSHIVNWFSWTRLLGERKLKRITFASNHNDQPSELIQVEYWNEEYVMRVWSFSKSYSTSENNNNLIVSSPAVIDFCSYFFYIINHYLVLYSPVDKQKWHSVTFDFFFSMILSFCIVLWWILVSRLFFRWLLYLGLGYIHYDPSFTLFPFSSKKLELGTALSFNISLRFIQLSTEKQRDQRCIIIWRLVELYIMQHREI